MDWLIFLQSKGLSRVFSNSTVQKHQFFWDQPSLWSTLHICTCLLENIEMCFFKALKNKAKLFCFALCISSPIALSPFFQVHPFRRRSSHLSSEFLTFSTEPTDIQLLPPLIWKHPTVTAAALGSLSSCHFSVWYFLPSPPGDIQWPCSHSALKSPLYECHIVFLLFLTFLWMHCLCTQKPKCWLFPRLCLWASSLHAVSGSSPPFLECLAPSWPQGHSWSLEIFPDLVCAVLLPILRLWLGCQISWNNLSNMDLLVLSYSLWTVYLCTQESKGLNITFLLLHPSHWIVTKSYRSFFWSF